METLKYTVSGGTLSIKTKTADDKYDGAGRLKSTRDRAGLITGSLDISDDIGFVADPGNKKILAFKIPNQQLPVRTA